MSILSKSLIRYGLVLLGTAAAVGCSSEGDGGTGTGSVTLSLSPSSATIAQGGSQAVTGTLTRLGGFTGTVNLTVTGQPSGVTATISNVQTSGSVTTATITILVDAATAPGTYQLVVHGTGTGVTEATANFSLTVTLAGSFTLAATPAGGVTMVQGTSDASKTIAITRTNYTAAITFTAESQGGGALPAGLTAAFAPNPTTANSSVLTLTASGSVVPNTYNVTIRGTGPASLRLPGDLASVEATTTLAVTITAPAASFSLSLTQASLSIAQGANTPTTTVNITRINFTGDVTLSMLNLPTGVTASFAPANPQSGNSSVLTLTVAAGAPLGTFTNLSVQGVGTPGTVSTPLSLTITAGTPAGGYTLSTTPPTSVGVTQGASVNVTVTINRTGGNTSDVALTATGALPAGMNLSFLPTSTTGNSSVLTISTTGATPVGATAIVIRGNTTGLGEQTANLTINVGAPGGSGNVTVDFSDCAVADQPVWAASQNGTPGMPWQVVTGVNNVYSFDVTAGRGGFTYVITGVNTSQVIVHYMSQAEWTAATIDFCGTTTPSGRTLTGTVGGLAANDFANVSFGGTGAVALGPTGNFTMNDAGTGTRDLVIYSHPQLIVAASDRMLIDRDENPVTSFGTRDMQTDPFAFLPAAGLVTITNPAGGETFTHSNTFYSRATCDAAALYFGMPVTGAQFNMYGAQTPLPAERHGLGISGVTGSTMFRSVFEYFNGITARNVAMGSQVPAGTTTEEGTTYSILRNQYTAPTDFNSSFTWTYNQISASKSAVVTATYGYFAGTTIDMKIGQYTGLPGWTPSWAPQAGLAADTYSAASGSTGTGDICTGLTRFILAGRAGSF